MSWWTRTSAICPGSPPGRTSRSGLAMGRCATSRCGTTRRSGRAIASPCCASRRGAALASGISRSASATSSRLRRRATTFRLAAEAERHLLIAGGIGITPIMAMIAELRRRRADFRLHYCTRSPEETAFLDDLAILAAQGRVQFHHDGGDPAKGLDLAATLREYRSGTHLYYCGPAGMMAAAEAASRHWPAGTVHCEYFAGRRLCLPILGVTPIRGHASALSGASASASLVWGDDAAAAAMSSAFSHLATTTVATPLPTRLVNARASDMKRSMPRISAMLATGIVPTLDRWRRAR